ncbi:MAG: DNA alkylation repair protein [Planctomycetota bacterium]
MNATQVLRELKSLGSEQTRKIYLRHGASEPLFGVKFGDLKPLSKKLGCDHDLASELWETGNSDAMTLALMIADPAKWKSSEIDRWLKPLDYSLLIDMLAGLVARSKFRAAKWKKWSKSKSEQPLVAAYALLADWVTNEPKEVPDELLEEALDRIGHQIHQSPNLARHSMNNALIAIGVARDDYRDAMMSVAESIGKVTVDHGETSCKTPDAAGYVTKALSSKHRRKR